jgi:CRISPR-associated protein Cmr5
VKNLAQKRVGVAIAYKGKIPKGQGEGNVLSGFPTLVRIGGLLAALAFALELDKDGNRKHKGEFTICQAVVEHLRGEGIVKAGNPDDFARELASGDATLLRRATAEALAFLNYLKRFAA